MNNEFVESALSSACFKIRLAPKKNSMDPDHESLLLQAEAVLSELPDDILAAADAPDLQISESTPLGKSTNYRQSTR